MQSGQLEPNSYVYELAITYLGDTADRNKEFISILRRNAIK